MIETPLPLAAELGAMLPATEPAPLLEQVTVLRLENAALRAQNAALEARVHELEARLGQTSANSSRPPSTDPPEAPPRSKAPPAGRRRGAQPGHRGAFRRPLPIEEPELPCQPGCRGGRSVCA
jgi:Family of unknown function (DUF6444)